MQFTFRKLWVLVVGILLSFQTTTAQELQWGKELKKAKKRSTMDDVIRIDENGIYAMMSYIKIGGFVSSIQLYTDDFTLKAEEEIKMRYKNNDITFSTCYSIGDKLYATGIFSNKKLKKEFLFAQEIDLKTLKLKGNLIKLSETDAGKSFAFGFGNTDFTNGRFYTRRSPNEKLLMVASSKGGKNVKEEVLVQVFDENMKEVWQSKRRLPYANNLFVTQEYRVDSYGDVYLLGKKYKDKIREEVNGKVNYQFKVLAFRKKGTDFREYPISIKGKFITDLSIRTNGKGNLVCAGFYSDHNSFSLKGAYFMSIDAESKQVLKTGLHAFSDEFLRKFMSKREKKKEKKGKLKDEKKELYRFNLDHFVLRDDGGAVLIAEQAYSVTYQVRDSNGNYTTRTRYYNNDIIVVNINPTGDIKWVTQIDKSQSGSSRYYLSFAYMVHQDKIHFLFNTWTSGRTQNIVHVTVDADGELDTKTLFTQTSKKTITLVPRNCEQVTDDVLLIYGDRLKDYKLGLVSYE